MNLGFSTDFSTYKLWDVGKSLTFTRPESFICRIAVTMPHASCLLEVIVRRSIRNAYSVPGTL